MDYHDEKVKRAIEVLQSYWGINKTTAKFTQQNAERLGLTLQQLSIVNLLKFTPGITLKEITQRLLSAKSTVSVSVEGLVQLGFVERQTSTEDRREINLRLTSEGEKVSKSSTQNPYSYQAMVSALEQMEETEIKQLVDLNKKLLENLQKVEF
ncbi:MarR family transcriptional regulator [Neobacillus pocheonensis]|uniref:MarR family transcriptional regulator n=1 Tax=Neobacillus pocheonensis TaxID=363869 RepID=A0ABT0WEQ7_9BACI|nr:MarR family transcriptional regulator [Neobacillus pocheonensis]